MKVKQYHSPNRHLLMFSPLYYSAIQLTEHTSATINWTNLR